MIPLVAGLLLMVLGFFLAQTMLHQRQLDISSGQFIDNTLNTLALTIENQTELLIALQNLILAKIDLATMLKYQQREQLLQAFKPEYERLLESQSITHFYFHKPDGHNLVRLHQPERYGDLIERLTLQQAQITGKVSPGLELGPLGNFTLRVVTPVIVERVVIGYMELGKEMEQILPRLQNQKKVDAALVIHKAGLERDLWEQGHSDHGHSNEFPWDRYENNILTYTSNPAIAEILDNYERHGTYTDEHYHPLEEMGHRHTDETDHEHEISQSFEINLNKKPTILTILPLEDTAGQIRAELILLHDISAPIATFRYWTSISAGVTLVTAVILISLLYSFLQKTDTAIGRQQQDLLDSKDRLEKARTVTNEGIWDWNLITQEVTFDERYYAMAGYTPDDFPASYQNWRQRLHPDDLVMAEQAAKDFIEGNLEKFDIEFRFLRKQGDYMWIRSRAKIFAYDEQGNPLRMVGTHSDIRDRKLAQDSLIKSEEKYRLLVETSRDWIWEIDAQGTYTYASPQCLKILGYPSDEIIGKSPFDLMPPTEAERVLGEFEDIIKNQSPIDSLININRHKNGNEVVLETSGLPFFDDKGDFAGYRGIDRDITDRRKITLQLKESEEKFSKAFYQQDIAMELVDLDQGLRLDFNDKYCEITGYNREELLNSNIFEKNLWLNPEGQLKAADELKNKGTISEVPMEIMTKNGAIKNLLLSATMLNLEQGKNIVIATLIDITHLKAAEQALRESEARFRIVFNQQYQFMAILSPEGITLEINNLPLETTGFSRQAFIGKPFWLTPAWKHLPEWSSIWQQRLKRAATIDEPIHTEDVYQTAEGETRYANSTTSAIKDSEGNLVFYLIEGADITKRRKTEKQRDDLLEEVQELNVNLELRVKQRTAELKAVNKELEAFSYSVSHDLRAPLRSIDGFSLALIEDYGHKLDDEGHDYLNRVRKSAQRMGQLIDDLLQLSRVNRDQISHEKVDLSLIAEKVIEELRNGEPDREVTVNLGKDLVVEGDPRLLRIMLDNLIGNAWKFTAKQERGEITLDRSAENPQVFFIKDNGVGFDMKHADKLFGAFQRLHRVTDFPGTGIGLATVQRILHRHGGKVWAEAELGMGAVFYFSLIRTKKIKNHPLKQHGVS